MKLNAYTNRDKIRDLYDIVFISKNYWDCLSDFAKGMLKDSLGFKGLEQFDYLMMYQEDELINKDKLSNDFLELFDKLGLLAKPTEEDENDFCM
ncbi:MAG: hypothetical protein LUF02_06150 [Erysipelotrichaceae bacterium]|nr:hypothetical protein [Erysipelotrichaceae bacterium]